MRYAATRTIAIAATLGAILAGCGADGEGEVTSLDEGSGSASASGSGSASGSATGSAIAAAEADCAPIGTDLEAQADQTVDVALLDYAFAPSDIEVDAGVVTFATSNEGEEAHEFAVLPGGGEVPLTEDGQPDEDALAEAGAFELEAYGPGKDCNATWELEPGQYTLFCIVQSPDGETHAEKGMLGELTVN